MTRDEAEEAGQLVEGLRQVTRMAKKLNEHIEEEPSDWVGMNMSINHSDDGNEHLGPTAILPPDMIAQAVMSLGAQIEGRLRQLGVFT